MSLAGFVPETCDNTEVPEMNEEAEFCDASVNDTVNHVPQKNTLETKSES